MGGSFSATNHVLPIPGGLSMGGRFQLQTTYSRFRRGVGHGRVVFSYKPCTPDSGGGGWPWGVLFQLQTTYSRFRRKKPVQRALILGASRLNGCTHFPDGGEAVWPDPGTLAQDPPARPFSGPRKARFDAPGADFSASLKKSGKESPRPVFSAPGGVGHGGCFFSYKPRTPDSQGGLAMGGVVFSYELRTPDSGDENRCQNQISLGGQVQKCVQIFPASILVGCVPPGC